ncbi:Short-chain dehydrogenase TIC 32, chloroplastic [Zancudomyces culisetae]|uniref:Short-chain dehydrogenase TIC 32, chloroplastic n=1 Tax=Zancudomyces culisetae TaxID=1213189 RepID=A0A1R1PSW8_ZANCU|nr:Short-chain dehydrogenase TIC 32, chloroplastic [Zancudomyces culisetae]|eukprot:OMH84019.1 Short-chain dehydrogenase TIC 32, chloroplastic [Zancudomyces culisetae]
MGWLEVTTNFFRRIFLGLFELLHIPTAEWIIGIPLEIKYNIFSKLKFGRFSAQSQIDQYVEKFKAKRKQSRLQQKGDEEMGGVDGILPKPVAIVTGASSGIGYETAKALVEAGFCTVLACRNESAAVNAIHMINKNRKDIEDPDAGVCEFMELDLTSFSSISKFIYTFKAKYDRLDVLVNNAGLAGSPYNTTTEGIEIHFGTNHIGHFILTNGLLDMLKTTSIEFADGINNNPRIIIVASAVHYDVTYDKELVTDRSKYKPFKNYQFSKLANVMYANELSRRLYEEDSKNKVTVNSLHPGIVYTNATRHFSMVKYAVIRALCLALFLHPRAGALTTIKLALSDEVNDISGKYFERGLELAPSKIAQDQENWSDLWLFTEELIASNSA